MNFTNRNKGNVLIIENTTDKWSFYIFNSEEIENYLEEVSSNDNVKNIALNLNGCDFIDSKGISILIHVSLKLKEKDGNLYLFAIPEHLKETLWHARSSGLTQWIELDAEEDLEKV